MNEPPPRVEKVAAFVTRAARDGAGRELLVFQHDNPLAGIQVPAGTVEPAESPREAVLREVAEEAGLTDIEVVGEPVLAPLELGDQEWYLALNGAGRPMLWEHDLASPVVRVLAREAERVRLAATHPDGSPVEWWAPAAAVTREVPRWLFHLRVTQDVPDQWERAFDRLAPWRFCWMPLAGAIPLAGAGPAWLEIMRSRLTSAG